MTYRYNFASEICDWPQPAKNLIATMALGGCDTVDDLKDYFIVEHNATFVYTTKAGPITHVLFPSEQEATMFILKWA